MYIIVIITTSQSAKFKGKLYHLFKVKYWIFFTCLIFEAKFSSLQQRLCKLISFMEEKKIIKIHSILEGTKKFFHALCIVKWQWRIVVGRYPMTAIKLHGCSRCTVAIVLRSAPSFLHTPFLEQNNLGIFLSLVINTFDIILN